MNFRNLFLRFWLGFLCVSVFPAYAQQESIQNEAKRLLNDLKVAANDTDRMYLLSDLSFIYIDTNPKLGLEYGHKALNLAHELKWPRGTAYVQNNLGSLYAAISDLPKALDYYFKALKNNELANHVKAIASNFGNIGTIYLRQRNFDKALFYYRKSLNIEKELKNEDGISSDLMNIGIIYRQKEELDTALLFFTEALKICESIKNYEGIAENLVNIGSTFEAQGKYEEALKYYGESIKIDLERGNISGLGANYGSIGSLYLKLLTDSTLKGKGEKFALNKAELIQLSRENLTKSVELLNKTGALYELRLVHKSLAELEEISGNYQKALKHYMEYSSLKDSIFSRENQIRISYLENQRTEDLKQKEIEIQKLQLLRARNRQTLLIAGLVALILVAFLVLKQRAVSEKLLLNILPAQIAKRLKKKESPIADQFEHASIIFIDIAGFTKLSGKIPPRELVSILNTIFTILDELVDKYNLEKIKTIGDCYMAVGGIPEAREGHADDVANFALEARDSIQGYTTQMGESLSFRTGIDIGMVVAGVIGQKKFIYDLWGDAVNTASRMESSGEEGKIQITDRFKSSLQGNFTFQSRGSMQIKGKGSMDTWFLER